MDSVLKQRLIGAAVIWALAFIFLPMLLQPPAQRSEEVSMVLPEPQEQPRQVRVVRLDGEDEPAGDSQVSSSDRAVEGGIPQPDDVADSESGHEGRAARAAPAGEAARGKTTKPAGADARGAGTGTEGAGAEGWIVQVGSFGDKDNAERLAERLSARNYAVSVSEFRLGDKVLYRVRVGPTQSRDKAEAQMARIQEQLGLNGKVLTYP